VDDVAAANSSAEDENQPHMDEVAAAKSSAEDAGDHGPTFGFPPGKTSFDKDSCVEDYMGRVSHGVSNQKTGCLKRYED
jgi:hypothetical protein